MQCNIIFKTIFEYIHKKFCFVHTNAFCKYRKKIRSSHRVHLVYIYSYVIFQCRADIEDYRFRKTVLQYTPPTLATVFSDSGAPMRRISPCIKYCMHNTDCLQGILYDSTNRKCVCTTTTPPETEPTGNLAVMYLEQTRWNPMQHTSGT